RVAEHTLESIGRHAPTALPGVPAFFSALLDHPDLHKYDLSSLEVCMSGAAPLSPGLQSRWERSTGLALVEGYGLSEAAPVTHANPIGGGNRAGTIGLPLPSTAARIVDPAGGTARLGVGEIGELIVRGPQVMKGYWDRPEETERVLRDGWLRTGDLAVADDNGYFRIVDRIKDVILDSRGLNIYPSEVEGVLLQHPDVKECAAVGVRARSEPGERLKVFVVLEEGRQTSVDELTAFCRDHLARYKNPQTIEIMDRLPRTRFGKVRRVALRSRG
ncbi:MAG: long-chain fatty acid--CoA ligase, partial [Anaerolineales bacterium]